MFSPKNYIYSRAEILASLAKNRQLIFAVADQGFFTLGNIGVLILESIASNISFILISFLY